MTDATTTRSRRSPLTHLHSLRSGLVQLDFEATSIQLVAVGLLVGMASLLILEPAAHRNTDTTTERVARISPVGEVRIAANEAPAAPGGVATQSALAAGNGS
ncbi:hypothetical protein [Thiohalocapsa sp.]|jgi:hypothetical protein|uniref:hypothetical protein n=1 Tax=Thiohalocapsa sp. TaxID=2497641 RepID=UPI0025F9F338|nr:hypothetical protein [Thiohalocapsa sp.]